MWKSALTSLLFTAMTVAAGSAQTPVSIADYCSAEHAFGQEFGLRQVEREGRIMNGNGSRRQFAPRATFAPFTNFEAGFTPTSRRLHSGQGSVFVTSREDARNTFVSLVSALLSDPRFQTHEIAEPDISPGGAVWRTARFYAGNSHEEAEQPSGFRVALYFIERVSAESTISMECTQASIYRTAEREALTE